MEQRTIDGFDYIKFDTPEGFDTWVLSQWPSIADFQAETGATFAQLQRRWIRVVTDRYNRRRIHRRSPNIVVVPR